jgi:hypothetical protein
MFSTTQTNGETNNITLCIGKQLGDGCNGDFPRKDYEGLCARCLMLDALANDPSEYERRQVGLQPLLPFSGSNPHRPRNTRNALSVVQLPETLRENSAEDVDA